MKEINSITLEIISNGVVSIAEQMGVILAKTGYSTNIKERKDLSVAVFSPDGKLISLAQHIPLHFSSLSGAIEVLLKKYKPEDIHDGDVFIANDPYTGGGSHLPDIVLVKPVFYHGRLVAFMVNTGHHADRSRKGPTIYDEGLRIPLVKLYSRGELVEDVFELIMLNFQMKYERRGDLNAQIITNQFGAEKFIELIDKIGLDTYESFCVKWLEYGDKKARKAIEELPDGEYFFEDSMDDDGIGGSVTIRLKLTVKGDSVTFDFTGTSPQNKGPHNCVLCALKATVYYSMMAILDHTIPANSGFFDSINVIAEEGSIVCAREPAPTSDRESTTQRIADVIFGAFSKINPEFVTAAGNGAMSYFSFSGYDRRTGKPYVYVETIGGGSGARYNKDGLDAVHVHMTNTSNLPVEALELEYPLTVEKYALSENSCGAGQYRGGLGIVRTIKITEDSLDTMLVSASTERSKLRPWGLQGGKSGGNSSIKIYRDGEKILDNPKPRNIRLEADDRIEMITAGAGGYGEVAKRDKRLLKQELNDGIIDEGWLDANGVSLE